MKVKIRCLNVTIICTYCPNRPNCKDGIIEAESVDSVITFAEAKKMALECLPCPDEVGFYECIDVAKQNINAKFEEGGEKE